MTDDNTPLEEEERAEQIEAGKSKPWLDMITQAEKTFRDYQEKADKIDKLYADLSMKANPARDREFALFWANIQVLGPSIYSRPPVPVVVPRFKDRKPVPGAASELLERASHVVFEMEDIDQVMRMVRDDVNIAARGVPWVRYETKKGERVCIEHVDRRDFLHEPARKWKEVGWVARRAWLDHEAMEDRFKDVPKDKLKEAAYEVQTDAKERGAADDRQKVAVWEIWSKDEDKVVWVTEGIDIVLDEGAPHLSLEGFYPCPRPAYATVQRGSLIPVPDMVFYKDQLEEVNELTARISALAEGVKVKGFYPAGAGEIGDAIEAAIHNTDNRRILVPISNFAAFGGGSAKDTIVWLPIDMIVSTIAQLIELRKQLIDDVYQITGLSDIMRGSTDANETLGAQELKSQYGSVRIRDKQNELIRVARDVCRIAAEIIAENFSKKTLLEMTQSDIANDADIKKQIAGLTQEGQGIEAQLQQAQSDPEIQQMVQQNPEKAQEIMQQAQGRLQAIQKQVQELAETPTIEKVMALLREQRLRPFVLDIETDSTIQPNEDAEKQRRTEFTQVLTGLLAQMGPAVQQNPAMAPFAGEVLKFSVAPFRAGRELDGAIDDFVETMKNAGGQQQEDPAAAAAQAEMATEQQRLKMEMEAKQAELQMRQQEAQTKAEADMQKMQADMQMKSVDAEAKQAETAAKLQQMTATMEAGQQKHMQDMEKGALEIEKLRVEIQRLQVQTGAQAQAAEIQAESAEQQADLNERGAALKERQAKQSEAAE